MSLFDQLRSSPAVVLRVVRSAAKSRPLAMRVGFFASLIVLAIACSDAVLPTAPTVAPTASLSNESGGDEVSTGPTVSTNQQDYAPGETVIITGAGFGPGEDVSLTFVEDPEMHAPWGWTVTADDQGGFVTDYFTVDESHVGVVFNLTATGQTSGLTATTIFTDGTIANASLTMYPGGSPTGGPPATGCSGLSGTTATSGQEVCARAVFDLSGGGETHAQIRFKSPTGVLTVHQRSPSYPSNLAVTATGFAASQTVSEEGTWTVYLCQSNNTATTGDHATGCPNLGTTQKASTTFTVGAGAPVHGAFTLEDAADGTGALIPAQNVASGGTVTAYLISRTSGGTFIANVAADSWSLQSKTGGVVDGDLVAAGDNKSATFTGALVGSAKIRGSKDSENPETGVLTVVAGAHDGYTLEDAADGTGSTIPSQNVTAGSSVTAYLISRDAEGNFIANVAADSWSLQGKTGGVVDGDLAAAGDNKSATFTGALVGSARIRGTKGSDNPETGTLTVVAGTAAKLAFTQQPSSSSVVGTAFAQQPKVTVQDAGGNTVAGDNTTQITLAIKAGTGTAGAALACTTNPVTVVAGVATFAGCKIDLVGTDYQLRATSSPAYTPAESDEFDITAASTTIAYNGVFQVTAGNSITMTATLSSAVAACVSGKTIEFRLDDPTDGVGYVYFSATTNANGVATTNLISTGAWQEGSYDVRAKFAGDANCTYSKDFASLLVIFPGNAATGGGFVTGGTGYNGRVNFGFNVRPVQPIGDPIQYKGQFLLINTDKWRCKGPLNSYGTLNGVNYAGGTCDLQEWDAVNEVWDVVPGGAGVSFQISFIDNGTGSKGKNATVDPDQFGFLVGWNGGPSVQIQDLRGGDINVGGNTSTTSGGTTSPGKKK